MARPSRLEYAGALYNVTARGGSPGADQYGKKGVGDKRESFTFALVPGPLRPGMHPS